MKNSENCLKSRKLALQTYISLKALASSAGEQGTCTHTCTYVHIPACDQISIQLMGLLFQQNIFCTANLQVF